MNVIRWHLNPQFCSHSNYDVCATCDFDRHYARKYPDVCPWAVTS